MRYLADELVVLVDELMCVAVDDLFGQEPGDVADAMINGQQSAVQGEQSVVLVLQRLEECQLLERISLDGLHQTDEQILWLAER